MSKTRLYITWRNMKVRCSYPKYKWYNRYGGRGIKVCSEWKECFLTFKVWAEDNGYSDKLQIDRVDNDKDYCPNNCRFVTSAENIQNQSTTKLDLGKVKEIRELWVEREMTQEAIGKIYGVHQNLISRIVNNKIWRV